MTRLLILLAVLLTFAIAPAPAIPAGAGNGPARRQVERLGRGVAAVRRDKGVFVSWRLLATDLDGIAFDVYRSTDGGPPAKVNRGPIAGPTGFVDADSDPGRSV